MGKSSNRPLTAARPDVCARTGSRPTPRAPRARRGPPRRNPERNLRCRGGASDVNWDLMAASRHEDPLPAPAAPERGPAPAAPAPASRGPLSPSRVLALQRAAGNRAVARALQRAPTDAPAASLDDRYRAALATARQTGDFGSAAELLNGFSRADVIARLAELSNDEIGRIHLTAAGNPAVGPDAQVAQLTAPGAPRASTPGPDRSQAPAPAPATPAPQGGGVDPDAAIAAMTGMQRLVEAYERAPINQQFRAKIMSMITPQALAAAIVSFTAAFVASQLTPVGWAADITLGVSMIFLGTALIKATDHLIHFAKAWDATTSKQIDAAAEAFANAIAEIEVDALLFLISKGVGAAGRGPGGPPVPAPTGGVLAMRGGTMVFVSARTIPATVAIEWGIAGSGAAMAMMGPDDPDFEDDPEVAKWERKFAGKPQRQRISDANKQELQDSGWLKQKLPDESRRRRFMKWLEERHNLREGKEHEHLKPGSPEAQQAVDEFNAEEP